MVKKIILLLILIFPFLKIFSQTYSIDPIVDTCAKYTDNLSYNTGEVYVIYNILNEPVFSKDLTLLNDAFNEILINEKISIYPNPVTDLLNISTTTGRTVNTVQLYSMDGKIIFDQQIQNNQIDLSKLLRGNYILKTDLSRTINFQIIKI